MQTISKKEKELMDYLESVVNRYASTDGDQNLDVCRKPELKIVEILGKKRLLMMSEVADRAGLSLSTVTSIVDGLVEKGFVRRHRSEQDRRVVRIQLTVQGRKLYREILQFHLQIVKGMLSALNRSEQDELISLFRKIVEKIDAENKPAVL